MEPLTPQKIKEFQRILDRSPEKEFQRIIDRGKPAKLRGPDLGEPWFILPYMRELEDEAY